MKFCLLLIFIFSSFYLFAETKIAILGDSNSSYDCIVDYAESYPQLVEKKFKKLGYDIKIINYSIPGAMAMHVNWMAVNAFYQEFPDIVVIAIGINDIAFGIPLEVTIKYLNDTIQLSLNHKAKVVVGLVEVERYSWVPFNYNIVAFNLMNSSLADNYPISFFKFIDKGILQSSADQKHLDKAGHQEVCARLIEVLLPILNQSN